MAKHNSNCGKFPAKKYSISDSKLMLSYARADATDNAKRLKEKLISLNIDNIFLDVDGIDGGDDWALILNNEILKCDVFIPLVTSEYGNTKWTRRELHLADLKDKIIIPINFLEQWPPDCLAIYLSHIQYIEWDSDVKKTAQSIKDLLRRKITQMIPPINLNSSLGVIDKSVVAENLIKMKPKIVISAHPDQREFTQFLRINMTAKFEFKIWCSLDVSIDSQTSAIDYQKIVEDFKSEAKSEETLFIIVLSKSYCLSKTCKQQAFYCDFRKKVVPIKYEEFDKPEWMSQLFTEDLMGKPLPNVELLSYDANEPNSFGILLNQRVSKLMNKMEPINGLNEMKANNSSEDQSLFNSSS